MVQRFDHVDADQDKDDNAGGDERDPGTLTHDLLAERDEKRGPDDKDGSQVGEYFDCDR